MEKLKPLQEKLKQRPAFQLDVMDCVTEKVFQKAVNQAYLDKNHGGNLLAYLQALKTKGLQKIQLAPRLKNGSTSKPGGTSVTVDLNGGSSAVESNGTSAQAPSQMMPAGLNAAASFGLGMPDILEGYAAKSKYEMLLQQHNLLLQDFKEEKESKRKWRNKAEEYQRTNDINEVEKNSEKEPSKFDKIIDGIFSNPQQTIPALMGAFNQFKGGGLNSPAEAQTVDSLEGYTEMQRALCEMISQCPDTFCEEISNIISRVAEQDKAFVTKLRDLLQTPNLKTVHNG